MKIKKRSKIAARRFVLNKSFKTENEDGSTKTQSDLEKWYYDTIKQIEEERKPAKFVKSRWSWNPEKREPVTGAVMEWDKSQMNFELAFEYDAASVITMPAPRTLPAVRTGFEKIK